jgi:hypothetical protein
VRERFAGAKKVGGGAPPFDPPRLAKNRTRVAPAQGGFPRREGAEADGNEEMTE